jgi:hypothetical protein
MDIQAEVAKLQGAYLESAQQQKLNIMLTGESGTGKTFLAATCPKPVHIDSFDPGGSKGLIEEIQRGEIVVDSRYELEDPMRPTAFTDWKRETEARIKGGYFDQFSTYMLDSSTMFASAIMNDILRKAGMPGQAPRFTHDYVPQKIEIQNWLKKILMLPCHVIVTGHLEMYEDAVEKTVKFRYMTTGKGAITLPLLFDEQWVMVPKKSSDGVEYRILTKSTGTYSARSRLARAGLLEQYENVTFRPGKTAELIGFKAILKKAGKSYEDKPLFKMGGAS